MQKYQEKPIALVLRDENGSNALLIQNTELINKPQNYFQVLKASSQSYLSQEFIGQVNRFYSTPCF